jgi:glycosyltransferase involved in cell wall biosynthesis
MAFGIPVVVSDQVGICSDILEFGAGEVVHCDVGEVAGALLHLLNAPLLRAQMGSRGMTLARERFSKQAVIQQVVRLYDSILK